MTDKIYYKVQYPMKKAINVLQDIEPEEKEQYNLSAEDKEKIKLFLNKWEEETQFELEDLINKLRKG